MDPVSLLQGPCLWDDAGGEIRIATRTRHLATNHHLREGGVFMTVLLRPLPPVRLLLCSLLLGLFFSAVGCGSSGSGDPPPPLPTPPVRGPMLTTWQFDKKRSGLNAQETALTPQTVTPQTFGKLFSYPVDGYVYAQPLLVSGLTINGGTHDVVFLATENDSIYAFDADTYGTGTPLWQVSLLQTGQSAIPHGPIQPVEGVTSTPVIDATSNMMYVVSMQTPADGGNDTFELHPLSTPPGREK